MKRLLPALLMASLLAGSIAGFSDRAYGQKAADAPDDARKFNDALVDANRRLSEAAFKMGKLLGPLVQAQKPVDIEQLAAAYDNVNRVFQTVVKDMKTVKVPESETAKAFFVAHQEFLRGQDKMVREDFREIIEVAADEKLAPSAKQKSIEQIIIRISKFEGDALKKLQEAQRAFAAEHGIPLKGAE